MAVLMPARNTGRWIEATLRSTLEQTFRDFVVLLVDDASTDATRALALATAGGDPRLIVIDGPGRGIVAALEAGRAALPLSVRYVARMDADDLTHPQRLALQVAALEAEPSVAVVASRVALLRDFDAGHDAGIDADGMARYVAWLNTLGSPESVAREIFVESPVCHPAVMLRRQALERVGGYLDPPWTEDYDLWLRLHLAGERFRVLPEVLHTWRDHGLRTTRTDPRCAPDRFPALKAHYLVRRFGRELRLWGAGRDGKRLARALEAEGAHLTAFIDIDPKKIGGVRRGQVPILSPEALTGPGDGAPIVTAVGIPSARHEIRGVLDQRGYREGVDYVCAA